MPFMQERRYSFSSEDKMMKAVIPLDTKSQSSMIAKHFARARYFGFIDSINSSVEILPNPCLGMLNQAGKCAWLYVTNRQKIDTVIAYDMGFHILHMIQNQNIRIILLNNKQQRLTQVLKLMEINRQTVSSV